MKVENIDATPSALTRLDGTDPRSLQEASGLGGQAMPQRVGELPI